MLHQFNLIIIKVKIFQILVSIIIQLIEGSFEFLDFHVYRIWQCHQKQKKQLKKGNENICYDISLRKLKNKIGEYLKEQKIIQALNCLNYILGYFNSWIEIYIIDKNEIQSVNIANTNKQLKNLKFLRINYAKFRILKDEIVQYFV
ncbi:unnamed protein product [Paramecium sonneborni]|uniref:Uncharacterized protein n=1 Tax=Paramecium sonneborni TaxID=65129 RepID=A0A8S1RD29_9CILI|nr:unnamed protein product [Paramecium sonneborni]